MESRWFVFDPPACYGNMPYIGNRDSGFRGGKTAMSMEDASIRRPFINSPSNLFDEDYCDEQLPDKKRRITQEQVILLEKSFEAENKLEPDRKIQLAKYLGLQPRQIAIWFQNRRARWKTKQLEREYDVLKSTYSSLLSDYDSIVKENEKLKFEVVSLSDKIDTKEGAGIPILPEKSNSSLADVTPNYSSGFGFKLEDGLSSGTGGSGVVDEDGPQLLDSGDSYFLSNEFTVMDGMHSEEDDRCNHALSYFPDVFQQNHVEIETLCWWDWS